MESVMIKPEVFIIEDNDSLSDIFTQAMKVAGFEIRTAANGLEAFDKLAELEPAVIILDLYLPGVSGDKILAYIRNEPRLQNSKIILTTFDSLLADKFRDQCDYVLLKPVSFGQLRDLGIKLRASMP
jgi:two-component system OmpR family response regulator